VVAHREELLERADRVFDMIDGNLVQRMRNLQPVSYAPEEAVVSR
jgi:ABC-type transport system involved in cytochrome bd biosynthesis fused ATPase/permease subunit